MARRIAALLVIVAGSAAGAEEPTVLRGRVLLPDGKPAAGADLYWMKVKPAQPDSPGEAWFAKRAAADEEGRFEFTLDKSDGPLGPYARPLIAHQPGFGVAWRNIVAGEMPPEATLRLAEDRPIRGRVTDTEGRPVADAQVTVSQIQAADGGLDEFLAGWGTNRGDALAKLDQKLQLFRPLAPVLSVITDKDGRFELSGAGAERLATLHIAAPGLVAEDISVVTRAGFDAAKYNQLAEDRPKPRAMTARRIRALVGCVFDQVLEAELVVRGQVFTGPDRQPVASASVSSSGGRQDMVSTLTDAIGHYELRGLRRGGKAMLRVSAAGAFLFQTFDVPVAPGQTTIDFDIELVKGVVVTGRVFDQATGRGVRSGMEFIPLPANDYVDQPGYDFAKRGRGTMSTDEEGRFRLVVVPGPGVIAARVQLGHPNVDGRKPNPYRQARFSEEDSKLVKVIADDDNRYFAARGNGQGSLTMQNAVKVIDLSRDSEPVSCDLPIDAGKTLKIAIEDEQGQPISNAFVAGVADSGITTFKIAEPNCTIYGLGADRPRRVCILHPQRKLAASFTLTGDEPGLVTVRLTAPASISGRALDPDGEPLADAVVQVSYMGRGASELYRLVNVESVPIKTDADGRFEVDNILPGERLVLGFKQGDAYLFLGGLTDEKRQLEAGQKLDVGDAKVKQLR